VKVEVFCENWEGLSLQAEQRSAPPKNPRVCLSQAPTKRGVSSFESEGPEQEIKRAKIELTVCG
jgi:hypothetical protein